MTCRRAAVPAASSIDERQRGPQRAKGSDDRFQIVTGCGWAGGARAAFSARRSPRPDRRARRRAGPALSATRTALTAGLRGAQLDLGLARTDIGVEGRPAGLGIGRRLAVHDAHDRVQRDQAGARHESQVGEVDEQLPRPTVVQPPHRVDEALEVGCVQLAVEGEDR